jgi:hypothetical protein
MPVTSRWTWSPLFLCLLLVNYTYYHVLYIHMGTCAHMHTRIHTHKYTCTCAHLFLWLPEPSFSHNILTLCFVVLPFVGVFKNLCTHMLWRFAVFHLCHFMKSILNT